MVRPSEQIKKDVVDELYWDASVDASNVKVTVMGDEVTLEGTVPNYTTRYDAAVDAWSIDGVKKVNNNLTVQFPPTFAAPVDSEVERNAKSTLMWNPDIYSPDINVTVKDSVVILEGTVDMYWKRWKAENLLSDLAGVKEIKNHLAVVPSDRFVDKNIASDIENALKRSLYVQAEDVAVKVEDGEVTLSGTVPTYYSRMKAFDAAINTAGVTDVNNYIVVT